MNEHVATTEEIRESYAGHDFDSEIWGVKFDTWLEEVKREAREQAWEEAWDKIRELPRWWSTEFNRGGFDIGSSADGVATEEGAYMCVREVMEKNPYRKEAG